VNVGGKEQPGHVSFLSQRTAMDRVNYW